MHLNGCDYLMLGFDHELRRAGFAGNLCQIVLELGSTISPEALKARLNSLANHYPILRARPGGMWNPKWKSARRAPVAQVRVHRDTPALGEDLFNQRLAMNRGELLRFDLIERKEGRTSVIFTWTHALMDAPGAEYFLALAGDSELPLPDTQLSRPRRPQRPLKERVKRAWKYLDQMDELCKAAPRALGVRHPHAQRRLCHRVEKFSAEETERIRANSARHCGVLGDAQYHAAVSAAELHQLHQRLGRTSPSYVLPVPVGLRLKGSLEPLFGNQVSMLMFQFLPEHLDSVASAVGALKKQMAQAMRADLLENGRILSELFRFLPLPLYMAILKQGLHGEICSLFYGDTNAVNPRLLSFQGAPVEDFAHLTAVTPSPGLGVLFYYFRGSLRVTILHSARVLTDGEAAEFAARLRKRLLSP